MLTPLPSPNVKIIVSLQGAQTSRVAALRGFCSPCSDSPAACAPATPLRGKASSSSSASSSLSAATSAVGRIRHPPAPPRSKPRALTHRTRTPAACCTLFSPRHMHRVCATGQGLPSSQPGRRSAHPSRPDRDVVPKFRIHCGPLGERLVHALRGAVGAGADLLECMSPGWHRPHESRRRRGSFTVREVVRCKLSETERERAVSVGRGCGVLWD